MTIRKTFTIDVTKCPKGILDPKHYNPGGCKCSTFEHQDFKVKAALRTLRGAYEVLGMLSESELEELGGTIFVDEEDSIRGAALQELVAEFLVQLRKRREDDERGADHNG